MSGDETAKVNTSVIAGGRYELIRMLGQGAMSKVYQGRDTMLGRMVAIKFLREEYGSDSNFVARFQREARSVASLPGEHIVDVYDYGEHNGSYYIVMEYVEGYDLKELIRKEGRQTPEQAVNLIRPVLLALKAAHAHGIIHRDIKPQNILVGAADRQVQLTDFGVARALDNAQVTGTGMVIGTAHYMAPEQARGGQVGPASDLYSVGVVLFELLSGRLPFEGSQPVEVLLAHATQPVPSLSSVGVNVPPWLEQVVRHALLKDPTRRYGSASEMLAALEGQAASIQREQAPTYSTAYQPTEINPPAPPAYLPPAVPANRRPSPDPALPAPRMASPTPAPTGVRRAVARPSPVPVARPLDPPQRSRRNWLPLLLGLVMLLGLGFVVFTLFLSGGRNPSQANVTAGATPRPTAVVSSQGVSQPFAFNINSTQLAGAYERTDGILYGRPERALYGAGSDFNQAVVTFNLDRVPAGKISLRLVGLDDERSGRCTLEIILNDVSLFRGPDTFPNVPAGDNGLGGSDRYWGEMVVTLPGSALRTGANRLVLRNNTPWEGALGVPYILIHTLSLQNG